MLKLSFYSSLVIIPTLTLILNYTSSYICIGYTGIVMCLILGVLGTSRGMSSISRYVSGVCISTPRVSNKSLLGTVICEAGLICTILQCILLFIKIMTMRDTLMNNYLILCSGIMVGSGFYFSSTAVGIICGVISLVDAKNQEIFFKLVVLEFMPASVGLLGFVLGNIISNLVILNKN
jgi:V-type H+-transporting ATPase 21kDa proteolipid subunit